MKIWVAFLGYQLGNQKKSELNYQRLIAVQAHEYWRNIQNRFPDLSSHAPAVLSIPASKIACERAFSTAGDF
jgi:hypothetical protein